MKRAWIATITAGLMMGASLCLASVSPDAIALGGVAPGSTVESAKSILGTPNYAGKKLYFPNGVIIEVDEHNPNLVEEIETRAQGAATPGGVQVGMEESVLESIYGRPDKFEQEYSENEYTYYSTDYFKKLKFEAVNGTIVKIKCEMR